ncbi:hypothetical protein DFJ73DRAFT_848724 [Zopfochytrium polystomum]|nr:hypothetical protein DFJ73DRAFT_848724 [Zopfochytrium polystomum]
MLVSRELITVDASSIATSDECGASTCRPDNVVDGLSWHLFGSSSASSTASTALNVTAPTRWASQKQVTNSSTSCDPQWLHFHFSSIVPISLARATIEYGDLSTVFDNVHFSCNTTMAFSSTRTVMRVDTITFFNTSGDNDFDDAIVSVQDLKIVWGSLVPMGSNSPRTCQMDIAEVRREERNEKHSTSV